MPNPDRRTFIKGVGQGALAAGIGIGRGLPEAAWADAGETKYCKEGNLPWPYPVAYGKENEIEADVLILGGGVAGCHAAINAARQGAKVVVVEKSAVIRSGCGGAGVDHWHGALTNPCSKVTPDEMMAMIHKLGPNKYLFAEYGNGITNYILFKESYDAILDVEKMGVKIRDEKDEFKGAEFRDDATKLMFAYDYDGRHIIRVKGGTDIKLAYYKELKRLGVRICDRTMVTSLLTEGGVQGSRVIGATGLHTRTGELYIFKSRAAVLSMSSPDGVWVFSTELKGASAHSDPNNVGDATAMAWEAGAEMALLERGGMTATGGLGYPDYGTANASNTWYACSIVDANGKEVPWVDRDGKPLTTVSERYHAAPGQKMFLPGAGAYELSGPSLCPDLPDRIKKGEFVLPLYADLAGMPALERRAIWGLMIYHESKTRIIYETYQGAGFDPDKDLLQANVMAPDQYRFSAWWSGTGPRQWRGGFMGGGVLYDWDMRSSLEGLYVAGETNYAGGDHALAATTGRYAGRRAAAYAKALKPSPVSREQIEKEKTRIYAPVTRTEGIGWKELRAGLSRIMQDYCGEYRNEETLKMGLSWFNSIRESEAAKVYARNPHELMRTVECLSRLTLGEVMIQASLSRKASSRMLGFNRIDYPQMDPQEWTKLVTVKLEKGEVKVGERPVDYFLQPPYAPSYAENYQKHSGL